VPINSGMKAKQFQQLAINHCIKVTFAAPCHQEMNGFTKITWQPFIN
jgi:hypothetical protein